jgi:hypothetical protein
VNTLFLRGESRPSPMAEGLARTSRREIKLNNKAKT